MHGFAWSSHKDDVWGCWGAGLWSLVRRGSIDVRPRCAVQNIFFISCCVAVCLFCCRCVAGVYLHGSAAVWCSLIFVHFLCLFVSVCRRVVSCSAVLFGCCHQVILVRCRTAPRFPGAVRRSQLKSAFARTVLDAAVVESVFHCCSFVCFRDRQFRFVPRATPQVSALAE